MLSSTWILVSLTHVFPFSTLLQFAVHLYKLKFNQRSFHYIIMLGEALLEIFMASIQLLKTQEPCQKNNVYQCSSIIAYSNRSPIRFSRMYSQAIQESYAFHTGKLSFFWLKASLGLEWHARSRVPKGCGCNPNKKKFSFLLISILA